MSARLFQDEQRVQRLFDAAGDEENPNCRIAHENGRGTGGHSSGLRLQRGGAARKRVGIHRVASILLSFIVGMRRTAAHDEVQRFRAGFEKLRLRPA